MSQLQRRLKEALQVFFDSDDKTQLAEFIADNACLNINMDGEYPDEHRIIDLRIGDSCYRIGRLSSQNDLLSIEKIPDSKFHEEPGVPFWLEGESLRQWVMKEKEEPSKGPVDWEKYR